MTEVVEVWAANMERELAVIMDIVEQYPYVAIDTEFPGVVVRPVASFKSSYDYHYNTLKCNVDLLKLIQVGFSFFDENGRSPEGMPGTWQFNFHFDLGEDLYAQDAIQLLEEAGIDFARHQDEGIDTVLFSEKLTVTGLVLNEDIQWISFHGGYDFAYLLRLLTGQDLPDEEFEFFQMVKYFFPHLYDVKYLMRSCEALFGGLDQLAENLGLQREGKAHQAGSDAMLTSAAFFELRARFFEGIFDQDKYDSVIYGLGHFSAKPSQRYVLK